MDGDGKPLIHTQIIKLFKFKAEVHPKPRGSINTTNVNAVVLNNRFMSPQINHCFLNRNPIKNKIKNNI